MNGMTRHQEEVFNEIVTRIKNNLCSFYRNDYIEDNLLSLTGSAGTGKSYLTAQITKEIMRFDVFSNDNICITAPTHKAVNVLKKMLEEHEIKDVDCKTIHSFLNIKPIYNYDTGEERFVVMQKVNSITKASLLIVDESSMLSRELFNFILKAVERGEINTVLFIGDQYQLLPVNSNANIVFNLKKQYQLTQVVRQAADSDIVKLATKIRKCIEKQDFISFEKLFEEVISKDITFFKNKKIFIEDYYKNEHWYEEDKVITSYTNDQVDFFNLKIRSQFWKERGINRPDSFLAKDLVRFKSTLNTNISNTTLYYNSEEVMIEKVELVKHQGLGLEFWKCTVVGREESDFFRVIDNNSIFNFNRLLQKYIDLAKHTREHFHREYWKKYFQLRNAFADVQYVFASTIHKLQGSTYDTAYIDLASLTNNKNLSNDLKFRLAYVAITRARKNIKVLY